MNINDAKIQIRNAITAYFSKDRFGEYRIPVEKQRPVFLYGPPGIGKTAIMEQIAAEMGVGLVSYSMTHHTRQSALGLPYIITKSYENHEYRATEYTMSEIIGSVYDLMKDTGIKEGILFLDEINCVSETLAPSMLQFLQYKVFGQHRIPAGWIVVTAGNPPEYNKSVRDFDIVTWDRMKRIDVEADYDTWKKYASEKGVHPSVTTYLDARRKDFCKIENTIDGKKFVTPRGWDDLSEMISLYEENHLDVDEKLISQYVQDPRIAKDFAIYYDLFNKYRSDYKIDKILEGKADDAIIFRAQNAPLDERVSLLGLLFDAVNHNIRQVCMEEDVSDILLSVLKQLRNDLSSGGEAVSLLQNASENKRDYLEKGRTASTLSLRQQYINEEVIAVLDEYRSNLMQQSSDAEEFTLIKNMFAERVSMMKKNAEKASDQLSNVFRFLDAAMNEDEALLIFVTELTANYYSARFIGHYGNEQYFMHNKQLQFAERQKELLQRTQELNWEL